MTSPTAPATTSTPYKHDEKIRPIRSPPSVIPTRQAKHESTDYAYDTLFRLHSRPKLQREVSSDGWLDRGQLIASKRLGGISSPYRSGWLLTDKLSGPESHENDVPFKHRDAGRVRGIATTELAPRNTFQRSGYFDFGDDQPTVGTRSVT